MSLPHSRSPDHQWNSNTSKNDAWDSLSKHLDPSRSLSTLTISLMEGYRKSDAMLGLVRPFSFLPVTKRRMSRTDADVQTYFDGIHNDPESVDRLAASKSTVG